MKKLWDFVCTNKECCYMEEFLVSKEEEYTPIECSKCGTSMHRSLIGGRVVLFDIEKHHYYLKRRSQEHTSQALKDGRSLDNNESSKCSDPVWNNKIRTKNTSRQTIAQHKYDYLK